MYKKTGQITAAVLVVAVVGIAAFFIASRFAGGDVIGQQVDQPADWVDDLRDRLEPTIQADRALPPARGPLGDFVIAGFTETEPKIEIPCARSPERAVDDPASIQQSELYSPAFGDALEVYDCPNGSVNFIGGYVQHETGVTEFARFHFVGDAIVESDAPRERLETTTVGGYPALVERGLDVSPFPRQNRIFVIERSPVGQAPGIMLVVFTPLDLKQGIELAEELMR